MATLKHIASKNSDYTAIEAYLVYQHDAFTGKQLLDEHGKPKLRDQRATSRKCRAETIRALAPDKNGTLIFSPGFAMVGQSKERAFEQKEKVHKHFPLSR